MVQFVQLLGALILLIASLSDLRKREVPDTISYGSIALFGWFFVYKLLTNFSVSFLVNYLASFALFFLIALLLFYTNMWGGGDSKILIALSFLLPVYIRPFSITNLITSPALVFMFNLILASSAYSLVYIFIIAFLNRKKFLKAYSKLESDFERRFHHLKRFSMWLSISLLPLFILSFKFFKPILFWPVFLSFSSFFLIFFSAFAYLSFKAVESSILTRSVTPSELVEGDWILDEIKDEHGQVVASPRDNGISKPQIDRLKALYKKKVIKFVRVKDGLPFIPGMLLAYLLLLFHINFLLIFARVFIAKI